MAWPEPQGVINVGWMGFAPIQLPQQNLARTWAELRNLADITCPDLMGK